MRVGIIGLGLIGGSLALALRHLSRSIEVIGVAKRAESAAEATQRGAVDRVDQGVAVFPRDCLVHRRLPTGETNQAAVAGPAGRRIRVFLDGFGEGRAHHERQVAEKRHLPVVLVGAHEAHGAADRAHDLEPGIERPDILTLDRCENPRLVRKDGGIARRQPSSRLASHRVTTEQTGWVR